MIDDLNMTAKIMVVSLIIFSTALHEMAHAFTATWLGDPTPGRCGRLTLNPIPHLQPAFTAIILPLLMFLSGRGLMILAQTPINPTRFRRPLRDQALVAVAGPLTNLAFGAVSLILLWILWTPEQKNLAAIVLEEVIVWSVILAIFNMMPIPPLDGYRIIRAFLPFSLRRPLDDFASGGAGIIVVFVLGGALVQVVAAPVISFIVWNLFPRLASGEF
jgi:Zn-dependent protease